MINVTRLRAALLSSGAALALVAIPALAGTAFAGEREELQARLDTLRARLDQLEKQKAVAEVKAPVAAPADAVVGGDFPGSFKLPGSDTSYAIHGNVLVVLPMDIDQSASGNSDFNPFDLVPNNSAPGNQGLRTLLEAEDSRINFQSRTPTAYGTLRTFIEGDFRGRFAGNDNVLPDNKGGFRLRHAYGELGPLLAGMTSSLNADFDAIERVKRASVIGPQTASDRRAQVRYTQPYGKFLFQAALEQPGGSKGKVAVSNGVGQFFENAGTGAPKVSDQQVELPSILGAVTYTEAWGRVRASGRLRQLRLNDGLGGDVGGTEHDVDKLGYSGIVSGTLKLGYFFPSLGKDKIVFGGALGTGDASVVKADDSQSLTVVNFGKSNQRAFTNAAWGVTGGIEHWWTGNLRSNLTYGISHLHLSHDIGFANVDVTSNKQVREAQEVLANLIWSPVKQVNFGLEYQYGQKDNLPDATGFSGFGSDNRVTLGFKYFY